jgi:hypothetical protein
LGVGVMAPEMSVLNPEEGRSPAFSSICNSF